MRARLQRSTRNQDHGRGHADRTWAATAAAAAAPSAAPVAQAPPPPTAGVPLSAQDILNRRQQAGMPVPPPAPPAVMTPSRQRWASGDPSQTPVPTAGQSLGAVVSGARTPPAGAVAEAVPGAVEGSRVTIPGTNQPGIVKGGFVFPLPAVRSPGAGAERWRSSPSPIWSSTSRAAATTPRSTRTQGPGALTSSGHRPGASMARSWAGRYVGLPHRTVGAARRCRTRCSSRRWQNEAAQRLDSAPGAIPALSSYISTNPGDAKLAAFGDQPPAAPAAPPPAAPPAPAPQQAQGQNPMLLASLMNAAGGGGGLSAAVSRAMQPMQDYNQLFLWDRHHA